MNLLSINIRGFSQSHKVEWIKELKTKQKIDFRSVQETHVANKNRANVTGCWQSNDFDFEFVQPHGKYGGLLCM